MALMRSRSSSVLINLLLLTQCFSFFYSIQGYDFFYFVLTDLIVTQKRVVATQPKGYQTDFTIHGLWPNYNNGSYPSNCDPNNPYDEYKIADLIGIMQREWTTLACPSSDGTKFWSHEWEKHGTCSENELDQHTYFVSALFLKRDIKLLQVLLDAEIAPDGRSYKVSDIRSAIEKGVGYVPAIRCNKDANGNSQLYEVNFCVDSTATTLIECPVFPKANCADSIEFPRFENTVHQQSLSVI